MLLKPLYTLSTGKRVARIPDQSHVIATHLHLYLPSTSPHPRYSALSTYSSVGYYL